ncbi:MAG TPA: PAS domain-containing protein [Patescibacteria group bacterium]|nr:PAS domain-containing protein [Patescibacteria group bacterium]
MKRLQSFRGIGALRGLAGPVVVQILDARRYSLLIVGCCLAVLLFSVPCQARGNDAGQFLSDAPPLLTVAPSSIPIVLAATLASESQSLPGMGPLAVHHLPVLFACVGGLFIFALGWIAALQRQRASIEKEKNLLATLIDHLPENVYAKDLEGRYVLTNQTHARFHGASSPEYFRGKTGAQLFDRQVARAYATADARILRGELNLLEIEETVCDGGGRMRRLQTTKVPLKNRAGAIVGLVGFSRDVTESKRAEDELRASEERFRAIWEHSIDGMQLTDHLGRILAVNEAFCKLVKLPPDRLVGRLLSVIYRPEQAAEIRESYLASFGSNKVKPRTTSQIVFWNLEQKDVEISTCFVDLGTDERAILSIFRDVSERRRVESVLAYERDLLTTLFEHLPDALYFKDLQCRFVRVSRSKLKRTWAMAISRHRYSAVLSALPEKENPAAADVSPPDHLATEEAFAEYIIGKTDFDFFDEPRARSAFNDEQEIIRSGVPLIGKVERTDLPDGKVSWALSTKMPWYDREGRIIGTFGVSNDITAMKEAEASVQLVHKQLVEASRQAGMAEVATGVLHNVGNVLNSVNVSVTLLAEKLLQSRTASLAKVVGMLHEHAADLGDFFTHDPRGVQLPAYLDKLARRLGDEQSSLLTEIRCLAKNVEHIKSIVAMQQTYARPAGVAEFVPAVELVEDALRINGGSLSRQEIKVLRHYQPELPGITIDKHKVLQILVNLVSNAGHSCFQSDRSDKRLTVQVSYRDSRLVIAVSDNGVGIAPENLTRIFNLGFTTRPDGHGFGLHSGALAARELGGTLTSHSEGPGQGATFTLELPLVQNGLNKAKP